MDNFKFAFLLGVVFTCGCIKFAEFLELNAPQPTPSAMPRAQFGTPPDCAHLYNVDKHREWSACMGVGYVTPMIRKDI